MSHPTPLRPHLPLSLSAIPKRKERTSQRGSIIIGASSSPKEFRKGAYTENFALLARLADGDDFVLVRTSPSNVARGIPGSVAGCELAQWGYDMGGPECAARVVPHGAGWYIGLTDVEEGFRYFLHNPTLLKGGPIAFDKGNTEGSVFVVSKVVRKLKEIRTDSREERLACNRIYPESGAKARTPSERSRRERGPRVWKQ